MSGEIESVGSGQFGLAPPPRAASWTNHLMDWVVLASNDVLPDQARLLYWLLKSFILDDKGQESDRVVQITQEDLADIRGCSVDTIQRALKSLYSTGLVEDRERRKVSVRVPGQKKPSVTTLLIMQINEAPPPAGYRGWSRPFDARKGVRARRAAPETAGRSDTARVRCQNDQAIVDNSPVVATDQSSATPANGHVDHQPDVSAGHCDTAPVPEIGAPVRQNRAPVRPIGSKSFRSKEVTTNQPAATAELPRVASQAGWLVETSSTKPNPRSPGGSPGEQLLASLPPPWLFGRRAIVELGPRVSTFLANGWTVAALTERWTTDRASKPLGALRYRIDDTPDWPDAGQVYLVLPDACAECLDKFPGARTNPEMRRRYDESIGTVVRCRTCHPELVRPPSTTPQGVLA